ncbi:Phosphotransferase enzyme family protein [Blastococcus aggregatus]|uniref:Phosphotransferase enzyme family protein n=1 Tax=Blastococcus aggregatus TaxID=38502 RepID=A0A285V8S7_9ACTN|nr:phosphotransferase [Blastococcus aggregatus]SOC50514.1 Phosphotransferase enzyme family protein [Blastococcus aggregatus]
MLEDAATTGLATWRDPAWRADALAWAGEQLGRAGLAVDGEPEQPHIRIWSTAFRLPLRGGGAAWLKAPGAGSASEVRLSGAFGRWVPDAVLVPLATDPPRRLLLLPDGGERLRTHGSDAATWAALLQAYAALQRELVQHAGKLLELGVPDLRPAALPGLVADLLDDDDAQLTGRPGGLDPAVRARVRADLPAYAAACRELAAGVPATVQHDDLHDGNVFVSGDRYRFFDWGDASVAHPFLSLLVALASATRVLGLPAGSPVLRRLRDAYLEPWSDAGSRRELREQCDLALRVAPLARALTWRRILRGVHPDERGDWAASVPEWTAEHLAPGPLAAAPS